jgi:acyl-CoA thioester hydrolase
MTTTPSGTPFITEIRVRYKDTDAAGVVYYGNYLTYFEVARVEWLRALGSPIRDVEAHGVLLPVVRAHVEYRRPARVDDLLAVHVWAERIGRSSFDFVYEVRCGDELIATGGTRHAVVDRETLRPLRLEGRVGDLVDAARRWAEGQRRS